MAIPGGTERTEKRPEKPPGPNEGKPPAEAKEVPALSIERLTHEDVPEMVALFRKVWEPYLGGMPPEVQKRWQPTPLEFTSRMEGVTFFAAKQGSHILGAVGCELVDGSCYLTNLCVEPEQRRHGVATALLAAAIGWAQHANARSIYVAVLGRFKEAVTVFKRRGFSPAGVLHRHFFGEDALLFEKIL